MLRAILVGLIALTMNAVPMSLHLGGVNGLGVRLALDTAEPRGGGFRPAPVMRPPASRPSTPAYRPPPPPPPRPAPPPVSRGSNPGARGASGPPPKAIALPPAARMPINRPITTGQPTRLAMPVLKGQSVLPGSPVRPVQTSGARTPVVLASMSGVSSTALRVAPNPGQARAVQASLKTALAAKPTREMQLRALMAQQAPRAASQPSAVVGGSVGSVGGGPPGGATGAPPTGKSPKGLSARFNAAATNQPAPSGSILSASQTRLVREQMTERAAAKAANYKRPDGSTWWPKDEGFLTRGKFLSNNEKSQLIFSRISERTGSQDTGRFGAPVNTKFENRSLPESHRSYTEKRYRIINPNAIEIEVGRSKPWFDKPGLGVQYRFSKSIQDMIRDGDIEEI